MLDCIDTQCIIPPLNAGSCLLDDVPQNFAHIKLLHVNARNLRAGDKLFELKNMASIANVDVIAVSETFLTHTTAALYNISGFEHQSIARSNRGGGGVSLFVHESFTVITSKSYASEDESVQLLVCHIQRRATSCYVAAFYSNSRNAFRSLLTLLNSALSELPLPILLLGDSNVNTLVSDSVSAEYLSSIASLGLLPIIGGITRIESGTCLDHIFVSAGRPVVEAHSRIILTNILSDHYPVWASLCFAEGSGNHYSPIKRRIYSSRNFLNFYWSLAATDMSAVFETPNVDNAIRRFESAIYYVYDRCFPVKKFYPSQHSRDPTFPDYLKRFRRQLDRLRLKYFQNKDNLLAKHNYYHTRNNYRRLRRRFFAEHVRTNTSGPITDKVWRFAKNLLYGRKPQKAPPELYIKGKIVNGSLSVANAFAEHFASIGEKTVMNNARAHRRTIASLLAHQPLQLPFKFGNIDSDTMLKASSSIKSTLAGPLNIVPSRILKESLPFVYLPLLHIFNMSVKAGVFPSAFKDCVTIPLYKGKGNKLEPSNYRPITLCSFLSKLLEKCVRLQLLRYLHATNFFSTSQYGFLKGGSTEAAVCDLYDQITHSAQEGNAALCAFIDVAKAFDCFCPASFDELLYALDFDAVTRRWFTSYLSDRYVRVRVDRIQSSPFPVVLGVPQGSCLGPTLFIMYLNVLLSYVDRIPNLRAVCYADDLTLCARIRKKHIDQDTLAFIKSLSTIAEVYSAMKLTVNVGKTELVLFKDARNPLRVQPLRHYTLKASFEIASSAKCLGIRFSEDLSWNQHFQSIIPKGYAVIAALSRMRKLGVPLESLIVFYNVLFLPVVTYGITLWGSAPHSQLHPLEVLQRDAVRAIFNLPRYVRIYSLMKQHGLMTLRQLYILRVACAMYRLRILQNDEARITRFVARPPPPYSIRRYHGSDVEINTELRTFCQRSPQYQYASIWNATPVAIRTCTSLRAFKCCMKAHLLNQDGN